MKNYFVVALCCTAILIGCQQSEEIENFSEKLPMSIEASIEESTDSRYVSSDNTLNNLSFTNNDAIGLSVNGKGFIEWTYNGSSWNTSNGIAYWEDKTSDHIFKAFYPYMNVGDDGSIPMPNLSGQTGEMSCVASKDFLVAEKTQKYGTNNGIVSFTGTNAFQHVSSLVQITLKGEGDLLNASVENIKLTGTNIVSSSTYNFSAQNKVVFTTDENGNVIDLNLSNCTIASAGKTFYFIVNTGTIELSNVSLNITYTSGNKNYIATLASLGASNHFFEQGKLYKYGLKVIDGVLTISGNSITDWTDGVVMDDIIINGVENNN